MRYAAASSPYPTRSRLLVASLSLSVAACELTLAPPEGAIILCDGPTDCPTGWSCSDDLGHCVVTSQDREPPAIVPGSVTLSRAAANQQAVVTVAFEVSEPLGLPPTVTLATPTPQTFLLTSSSGQSYAAQREVIALGNDGSWPLLARLVDRAGNVAAEQPLGTLVVDSIAPLVVGEVSVEPPVLGRAGTTRIRFAVTEAVAEPQVSITWPATPELTGRPATLVRVDDPTRTFELEYQAAGTEPSGPANIEIDLTDIAGNRTRLNTPDVLRFDLVGPVVIAATAVTQLFPSAPSLISHPTEATYGTTVRVIFSLDEAQSDVVDPQVRTTGTPALELAMVEQFGRTTFIFEHTLSTDAGVDYPQGVQLLQIVATDALGNEAVSTLEGAASALVIDTLAPAPPDTSTFGRLQLSREPWGTDASAGQRRLRLQGGAGSVPSCTPDPGEDCDCCGFVIACDRPNLDGGRILGIQRAASDGSFAAFDLDAVDAPTVYVAAMDPAGNISDADASAPGNQALPTLDVRWIATLAGKSPNNTVGNPHVILTTSRAEVGMEPPVGTALEPTAEELAGLARVDGLGPEIGGALTWRLFEAASVKRPVPRAGARMVFDNGAARAILFGGSGSSSGACGSLNQFCSDTWIWQDAQWRKVLATRHDPLARYQHGMVFDSARRRVVMFGGWLTSNTSANDTWIFANDRWTEVTPTTPSPQARRLPAMAYDPVRDRVVLFGGHVGYLLSCNGTGKENCGDTWEWNGAAWELRAPSAPTPQPRMGAMMAYDATRGEIVMFGGQAYAQGGVCEAAGVAGFNAHCTANDTWAWNGEAWRNITPASGSPPYRGEGGLAFDAARGELVLFGGRDITTPAVDGFHSDTWVFRDHRWIAPTPGGAARSKLTGVAMTYDTTRQLVLVFGGTSAPGVNHNSLWEWDGRAWGEIAGGVSPTARASHSLIYDRNTANVVALAGRGTDCDGAGTGSFCDDLWLWNGNSWTTRPRQTGEPLGRTGHVAAFVRDSTAPGIVLFGGTSWEGTGCGEGAVSDCIKTWRFDGTAWTDVTPIDSTKSPGKRSGAAAAYDPVRNRLVLFGGYAYLGTCTPVLSNTCGDVREWGKYGATTCGNGQEWCWLDRTPTTGVMPSPRSGAMMAYDPVNDGMVLFGGAYSPGGPTTLYDETWLWQNAAWTKLEPTTKPGLRSDGSMVHDPLSGAVVLYGGMGTTSSAMLTDTWLWTGSNWVDISPDGPTPSGKYGHALAVDEARGELLVFAGNVSYNLPGNELWRQDVRPRSGPTAFIAVSWASSGASTDELYALHLDLVAQGRGHPASAAAATDVYGVAMSAWNHTTERWQPLAAVIEPVAVGPQEVRASVTGARAVQELVGGDGLLRLRVQPVGSAGHTLTDVELLVDYLAVELRYAWGRTAACGDGVVDLLEQCDDGNTTDDADGCSGTCGRRGFCGDGVVQAAFETCEPPDTASCTSTCRDLQNPCCEATRVPGCQAPGDAAVEACVCAIDGSCCGLLWDFPCTVLVETLGCAVCR